MIKALTAVVGLVVVAMGSGCMSAAQSARAYATADLRCPSSQIVVTEVASATFRARGCGREAYYLDDNAPSTTVAQGETARPTFRHAARASR